MSAFHNELNTLPREFIRKYTPKGAYQELLSLGSVSGNTILVSQEVLSLWSVQEILPDPLNLNLPEPPLRRDVLLSCIPISSLDARELSCFSSRIPVAYLGQTPNALSVTLEMGHVCSGTSWRPADALMHLEGTPRHLIGTLAS